MGVHRFRPSPIDRCIQRLSHTPTRSRTTSWEKKDHHIKVLLQQINTQHTLQFSTSNMVVAIDSGIPLWGDLEQPLLSPEEMAGLVVRSSGEEDSDDPEEPILLLVDEDFQIDENIVEEVYQYYLVMGWSLGFLFQCLSLGASAVIALRWETLPTMDEDTTSSWQEQLMYWTVFGLSNSWLLLFPVVCVGMQLSWRDSGIRFFLTNLLAMDEPIVTQQARRMTFVASVRFLIGVVLGCFLTWGLIDLYLGASRGMLLALFVSMLACLALCQWMIVIYDSWASPNQICNEDEGDCRRSSSSSHTKRIGQS